MIILALVFAIAVSVAFIAAVTGWGVIPVVEAFGGPELPFWPTFVVVWALWCMCTYRPVTQLSKKK